PEHAGFLVQLVLDAGAHGDFDHRRELRRQILSRRHIVPGMPHGVALVAAPLAGLMVSSSSRNTPAPAPANPSAPPAPGCAGTRIAGSPLPDRAAASRPPP